MWIPRWMRTKRKVKIGMLDWKPKKKAEREQQHVSSSHPGRGEREETWPISSGKGPNPNLGRLQYQPDLDQRSMGNKLLPCVRSGSCCANKHSDNGKRPCKPGWIFIRVSGKRLCVINFWFIKLVSVTLNYLKWRSVHKIRHLWNTTGVYTAFAIGNLLREYPPI